MKKYINLFLIVSLSYRCSEIPIASQEAMTNTLDLPTFEMRALHKEKITIDNPITDIFLFNYPTLEETKCLIRPIKQHHHIITDYTLKDMQINGKIVQLQQIFLIVTFKKEHSILLKVGDYIGNELHQIIEITNNKIIIKAWEKNKLECWTIDYIILHY